MYKGIVDTRVPYIIYHTLINGKIFKDPNFHLRIVAEAERNQYGLRRPIITKAILGKDLQCFIFVGIEENRISYTLPICSGSWLNSPLLTIDTINSPMEVKRLELIDSECFAFHNLVQIKEILLESFNTIPEQSKPWSVWLPLRIDTNDTYLISFNPFEI